MKKFSIYLLFVLSIFFLGFKLFESPEYIPKDEQIVNSLLGEMAGVLKKKYNIRPIGTIVSMPDGVVKKLGLEFYVYGPLSKEEIRKLLINCSQEFLTAVNNDVEVRPYLECYPFTIGRIGIGFFMRNKNNSRIEYPNISIARVMEQTIRYTKLIKEDIPVVKDEYIESYEDAVKILEQQSN